MEKQTIRLTYKDEDERRIMEKAHENGYPQIFGRLVEIMWGTKQPSLNFSSRFLNNLLDRNQIAAHKKWIEEMKKKPAWNLLSPRQKQMIEDYYWYTE